MLTCLVLCVGDYGTVFAGLLQSDPIVQSQDEKLDSTKESLSCGFWGFD